MGDGINRWQGTVRKQWKSRDEEHPGEENSRTRNFPERESVEGEEQEQLGARNSCGRGSVEGEEQLVEELRAGEECGVSNSRGKDQ